MAQNTNWKLLERKKAFASKFVTVYEDTVELPSGKIIDDYTVIEKPNVVIIVATDSNNNIIVLHEYKYAAGKKLLTLPAGHIEKNEDTLSAAKRELLEETGFGSEELEEIGELYEYPTKDLHKIYVVRAKNVIRKASLQHEETEMIEGQLLSVDEVRKQIKNGEWKISGTLAALTLSGILS